MEQPLQVQLRQDSKNVPFPVELPVALLLVHRVPELLDDRGNQVGLKLSVNFVEAAAHFNNEVLVLRWDVRLGYWLSHSLDVRLHEHMLDFFKNRVSLVLLVWNVLDEIYENFNFLGILLQFERRDWGSSFLLVIDQL